MKKRKPLCIKGALGTYIAAWVCSAFAQEQRVDLVCTSKTMVEIAHEVVKTSSTDILNDPKMLAGYCAIDTLQGTLDQGSAQLAHGIDTKAERTNQSAYASVQAVHRKSAEFELSHQKIQLAQPTRVDIKLQSPAKSNPESRESEQSAEVSTNLTNKTEIVVTGSRLKSLKDGPVPITIFNRDQIDRLGVSTVSDLLSYMPQQPFAYNDSVYSQGVRFVQLRGLPVDLSAVLINGRRTFPSAAAGNFNAFDLNTIPLAAVERVEVLSDSASAVYGADAVGGVLNIVLKESVDRPTLAIHYGGADGGGTERRASVAGGFTSGRLRLSAVADYFEQEFLLGDKRTLTANQDYSRFGDVFKRAGGGDRRSLSANPGNISSISGDNLPGLSSPIAAVPSGGTQDAVTIEDFVSTAGQRNLESLDRFRSLIPDAERFGVMLFSEFDVTPTAAIFTELLYSNRKNVFQVAPSSISGVAAAENPFNPFGVDVRVNYLLSELGAIRSVTDSEMRRAVAGLRWNLGSWDSELSWLSAKEEGSSWLENVADSALVSAALMQSDPARSLNVFKEGPGASPAFLATLRRDPKESLRRHASRGWQVSGFVRGPLADVAAGSMDVVFGAEFRSEELLHNGGATSQVLGDRRSSALFSEVRLPIVKEHMEIAYMNELELTAAVRYDRYSSFGGTTNPQLGVIWRPIPGWLLRASYGRSFRPPSIAELFRLKSDVPLTIPVVDPRRQNEIVSGAFLTSGGNQELEPTKGKAQTYGIVFTPPRIADLRVSTSFWRIRIDKRVASLSPQTVLTFEHLFPQNVLRESPSAADAAAGMPGKVNRLDVSNVNFGTLETNGVDFEASYVLRTDIGSFRPSLSMTWVSKYKEERVPGVPSITRVGIANSAGSIARLKGVASMMWERGGIGLSATARYTPSYEDADLFNTPTGRTISSQVLLDCQVSADLSKAASDAAAWWNNMSISAGVVNLLNDGPGFSEVTIAGYDMYQSDIRQRFGYVSIQKQF